VGRYDEYRKTTDYKKLVKISKDYYDRYSTELSSYWTDARPKNNKSVETVFKSCIEEVTKSI
jgi:hypothetical protein